MELTETIDSINRQLIELFGIDTITGLPMWRVAWSEDQFEYRHGTFTDYTPSGLYVRTVTETRYVPKYRQWIKERYVLERLCLIPIINTGDLPAVKQSYEPIYPFESVNGLYLPPRIDAAKFVIDTVLAAQGKGSLAKYKDPLAGLSTEDLIQQKREEIKTLQDELFGNETATGDSMAHGEAVIVPRNYSGEN